MVICNFCNKERIVTIKLELSNSETDDQIDEPYLIRICLLCLHKKEYKIDIREIFKLEYEDLIDFPEDYFKEE